MHVSDTHVLQVSDMWIRNMAICMYCTFQIENMYVLHVSDTLVLHVSDIWTCNMATWMCRTFQISEYIIWKYACSARFRYLEKNYITKKKTTLHAIWQYECFRYLNILYENMHVVHVSDIWTCNMAIWMYCSFSIRMYCTFRIFMFQIRTFQIRMFHIRLYCTFQICEYAIWQYACITRFRYEVATVTRIDTIIDLLCRIWPLL